MSIVDKSHLQIVALGMWNKVQEKLNGYVHKTKDNVIAGKTVLLDGYITGVSVFNVSNPRANGIMSSDTCLFVCENMRVSANQKVCQVTIGVNSSKQIGDKITGVNIGAIKVSNGQVLDYVIQNGVAYVHKNIDSQLGCDKAITINIDKTWTEDVRLMVGANGALWGQRDNNYGGNAKGMTSLPNVGDTVVLEIGGNYIGKVITYGEDLALRDLGNSSTNMVTKDEFNAHKGESSREHQALQTSINNVSGNVTTISGKVDTNKQNITSLTTQLGTTNQNVTNVSSRLDTTNQNVSNLSSRVDSANNNISSQGQRISSLENNTAKLNVRNRFTAQNTFMERNPIVEKYASIKDIYTADGVNALFEGGHYCCNPSEGITNSNAYISALLLPIKNSQPGDTIDASYFTLNASTKRVTSGILESKTYTVLDVQYRGEYCIALNVGRTFNYPVGFGFRVRDKVVVGRRIGMLKQNLPNQHNNNAWSYYTAPSNNDYVGSCNEKFTIPYMIASRVISELVTRHDITLINNNPIGELKLMAFDMGESFKMNGQVWLKCEGQSVSTAEYSELYNVVVQARGIEVEETQSDFNLPLDNSFMGYTYICAK